MGGKNPLFVVCVEMHPEVQLKQMRHFQSLSYTKDVVSYDL